MGDKGVEEEVEGIKRHHFKQQAGRAKRKRLARARRRMQIASRRRNR